MPRAKRDKKISLTKTERKGQQWKRQIVEDIRNCVEKYPNVFLFSVQNMRNTLLKELRAEWKKKSRFIFGKNRLMALALGQTNENEIKPGLHKLSRRLQGQCGLLFTEETKDRVLEWAQNYSALEYARSGFIATETVTLQEGPLEDFSHAIEPHLRSLGLPTQLQKGIITLYKDYTVCTEGKALTPEQARILKLIAHPMATFALTIKCCFTKSDGFESIINDNDNENENSEEVEVKKISDKIVSEAEITDDEDDEMESG